ncbi:putative polyketide synthase [Colletotrichum karsti]|uniref:Polyketide synthase n=1 Tax=Colletotrichum karsti TaxID=1095194 RepID=A0A9P6I1B9_9PEZI|nr:putative polyketide synthase [Colletotrichum karsti]KAF9873041.1 putative polyketide synthase [Colletotrichum karsti]
MENTDEAIAIVGMSCRLPGEASSLDDFWRLMCRSRSGWSTIPEDRFSKDAYHHPSAERTGGINSEGGYFLKEDLSLFDAPFFRITKEEAQAMDPQQRILLECAYEALENSGSPMDRIDGRRVGVFVGAGPSDYRTANMRDLDTTPTFDTTGNQEAFMAGRVSYFFNLKGPSLTVDTACSSSLSALHLAVQSIRSGESEQAIVGASHVNLSPDHWVSMSNLRLFSDAGITYAFDHRAKSGYARGEGGGCLVLKPLHLALKDNDRIRAIVTNTGINHNGTTVGIVAPSAEQQERLITDTCRAANVDVRDIGFLEAHGTGTRVGDPIEALGIYRAIASFHPPGQPLRIGSVKTNVGHLENASGIVSVIKAAMMLERGFILPNLNFEKANDEIHMSEWNLEVPTRQTTWPSDKKYACINNFGFSGVNGHCILERPPPIGQFPGEHQTWEPIDRVFVLSATDRSSLEASMTQLGIFLEQHAELFQATLAQNLAYTLCQRRSHLPWRAVFVSRSCTELVQVLNKPPVSLQYAPRKAPKVAFVFTGQGAQWYAMGRELLQSHQVFASTLKRADEHLLSMGASFSVLDELLKDKEASQVGLAYVSQPACTAIQLGLTDLLRSWGIEPSSVVGHSSGEIAAAYAANALTLESAMELAYYRGQCVLQLKREHPDHKGAMMAVGQGASYLRELLSREQFGDSVVVACENSPTSTTLSGDSEAIARLAPILEQENMFNRALQVEAAYHSPAMALVAESYKNDIGHIEHVSSSTDVQFFSSLHSHRIDTSELNAKYWTDNLTNPVRFATALKELYVETTPDILIEVGPHAALQGPIKQTLKEVVGSAEITYFPTLVRNKNATSTCLDLAGNLFTRGVPLDFFQINHVRGITEKPTLVSVLPPYPWSRQKFWHESRISRQHRLKPFPRNDLLGTFADYSDDVNLTWRNIVRVEDAKWLVGCKPTSDMMVPASVMVAMAVEAAGQHAKAAGTEVESFTGREIEMPEPLILEDGAEYDLVTTLSPNITDAHGASGFRIRSWERNRGWLDHCRGQVTTHEKRFYPPQRQSDQPVVQMTSTPEVFNSETAISKAEFYKQLLGHGWQYPELMKCVDDVQESGSKITANWDASNLLLAGHTMKLKSPSAVDPEALESMLQLSLFGFSRQKVHPDARYGPYYIHELFVDAQILLKGDNRHTIAMGTSDLAGQRTLNTQLECSEPSGSSFTSLSMVGIEMAPMMNTISIPKEPPRLCHTIQWEPAVKDEDTSYKTDSSLSSSNQLSHREKIKFLIISEWGRYHSFILALEEALTSSYGANIEISSLMDAEPDGKVCIFLSEMDDLILSGPTEDQFLQIQRMLISSSACVWVARGGYRHPERPHANLCAGLLRTLRTEYEANAALIELDPSSSLGFEGQSGLVVSVVRRLLALESTGDFEYAEDDGQLVVPRIVEDKETNTVVGQQLNPDATFEQDFHQPGRCLALGVGIPGDLESLYFDDLSQQSPIDDEIEIQVSASGINNSDISSFTRKSLPRHDIGSQVGGIVSKVGSHVTRLSVGDKVCVITNRAFCTSVTCTSAAAAKVPDWMSFDEAASIPVPYCTASYALVEAANVLKDEVVVIQWTGDTSLAAIQLAKIIGADVYVAVQSEDDRARIIGMDCVIKDAQIFNSRSPHFVKELENATNGRGADVIVAFSGPGQSTMWSCIADFGRIVEVKTSVEQRSRGKTHFADLKSNCTFTQVNLDSLVRSRPKIVERVLLRVMKLFQDRTIVPKAPAVFGISETLQAFRKVMDDENTSPVVVANRPGERVQATSPRSLAAFSHSNSTHLIVGGSGGLGLCVARWMIQNGARYIVLLSRSGGTNDKVRELMNETKSQGVSVIVKSCDVSNETEVQQVMLELAKTLPPIRGVVHAAMVLRDMPFEEMKLADYNEVTRPKVAGVWNIHNALGNTKLQYFVVLSSMAGVIGSRGQAAYAAANTFLDSFARYRVQNGLAATAVSLPPVVDAGFILEHPERKEAILRNFGGQSVETDEVLGILGAILAGTSTGQNQGHLMVGLDRNSDAGNRPPCYSRDLRFQSLAKTEHTLPDKPGAAAKTPLQIVNERIHDQSFAAEARALISQEIRIKLSSILMRPLEEIDSHRSITAYGLDSLNAIELRNWIAKELRVNFQVLELITSDSVDHMSELIVGKMIQSS